MTTRPASPITGIDHIAILVRDIDASLPYYRDVLGLAVVADDVNEAAGVRLLYLDAGNLAIQLVSPFAAGAIAAALDEHGEGLHHVCFKVEEMSVAVGALAPAADVVVTRGGRNRLTCFLPDRPNGLIMELTEIDEADD